MCLFLCPAMNLCHSLSPVRETGSPPWKGLFTNGLQDFTFPFFYGCVCLGEACTGVDNVAYRENGLWF